MEIVDPSTEERSEFSVTPLRDLPALAAATHAASLLWQHRGLPERIAVVRSLMERIAEEREGIERLIGRDMGKPRAAAATEVDRTLAEAKLYLEHAAIWLAPESIPDGVLTLRPLGVIGVISPWNFPLMIPMRSIVPALIAGNGVIWKPSELTLPTSQRIGELLHDVLGEHRAIVSLILGGREHGEALLDLPTQLVAFTGSTSTGRFIAERCARRLVRTVMELGGLDAAVVLPGANLARVSPAIVRANLFNSGQSCSAVKRVFVPRALVDQFCERAAAEASSFTYGSPASSAQYGPLASENQLNRAEAFLADAVAKGARVWCGGARLPRPGYFLPSTVLSQVSHDARVLCEEPFAPILPVVGYDSVEEAIALANGTPYGLNASVWGEDKIECERVAERLEAGTVLINKHTPTPPGVPFGGVKGSGWGRIKCRQGLLEYVDPVAIQR